MRTKYKKWAQPYLEENKDVSILKEDIREFLNKKLYLEIGPGKGDFIIEMAKKNPESLFIGIELNLTIAAIAAKKVKESGVINAKIMNCDAFDVFEFVGSETIEGIFLNFSDPWPKKRHEKRRLTHERFLNEYFKVLKNKSLLTLKTDNDLLYAYSIESLEQSKFTVLRNDKDYDGKDEFDAQTEYETNFRKVNKNIYKVVCVKE